MNAPVKTLLTLCIAVCLGTSSAAMAQGGAPRPPAVGDRVRITTDSSKRRTVGALLSIAPSGFTVQPQGKPHSLTVPVADVRSMEISTGSRSQIGRGIGYGLMAGVVFGFVTGFLDGDDPPGFLAFSAEEKAAMGGIVFGVIGGTVGLFWGAIDRTDRWTPAAITR